MPVRAKLSPAGGRNHGGNILGRIKSFIGTVLDRNPRVSFFAYGLVARCPLLLPHDRSYLGIRLLEPYMGHEESGTTDSRLILDVGANNGISSRGFIKLLPGWNVHAIEANSVHIHNLQRIKSKFNNRFDFTIGSVGSISRTSNQTIRLHTPVWKGLPLHTVTSTRANIAVNTAVQVWKLRRSDIRTVETESPLLTVDDLNLSPSIVKIDAEGSELKILEGMTDTVRRSRPVVIMEVTTDGADRAIDLILKLGFSPFRYDELNDALIPQALTRAQHITGQRNWYFIPSSRVDRSVASENSHVSAPAAKDN